jgi:hypothetical protein
MQLERTENLLYEKFYRKDKFHLPEGAGVLTASNDYMFPGLQFLYYSIALSHVARICVIDCGLTAVQRSWCEKMGMKVVVLTTEDMLFKKDERETHVWNKGAYFEKSPFRKTLWIDSDCVVQDNLGLYFDMLESGPVFTEDHFAPKILMCNQNLLYLHLPIAPQKRGKVALIESWHYCVKRAADDEAIKDTIAWFDQGALMWAVEKNGLTHRIRRERALNFPAMKVGGHWGEAQRNPVGFLESIGEEPCVVRHFMSHPKPWHHWRKGGLTLDFTDSFASKVKIFILGHNQEVIDRVPDRPYFEKVNLGELPLDRFQNNQLAESRIFLAPFMHRIEQEYVGFSSARWNDKYAYLGTTRIEDMHTLKLLLKPTNVIVAQRTDNVNGPLGSLDPVNWRTHFEFSHKGITHYLDELAKVSGINNLNPSFWANNFICHRSVFKDFLKHWLDVFFHFYSKYGFDYKFEAMDPTRSAAFLLEAITVNYFSSRKDLRIVEATKRDTAYKIL